MSKSAAAAYRSLGLALNGVRLLSPSSNSDSLDPPDLSASARRLSAACVSC